MDITPISKEAFAVLAECEETRQPFGIITFVPDEKTRINLDYAKQDIERANENRIKLLYKYEILMKQLSKEISNTINYGKEEKD